MREPRVLLTGLAFGESPRWHDGRLWLSDWGAYEALAVDPAGRAEVVAKLPSFPSCIDFLRDGRLLVVSAHDGRLLRREADGSLATYADLSGLADHPWNEVVVDGRDNAYVNNIGFDFPDGEPAPGTIALVGPDGSARQVADDLWFPNGMAVTPDNTTLIVPESYANRLTALHRRRRQPVEPPDLGRPRRRGTRRHLPRCRRGDLVRRRPQYARGAGPRGERGTGHDRAGPRLLRLRARRYRWAHPVPGRHGLERRERRHDGRSPNRSGAHRGGPGARCRLGVTGVPERGRFAWKGRSP
jgi:hypothetical protein